MVSIFSTARNSRVMCLQANFKPGKFDGLRADEEEHLKHELMPLCAPQLGCAPADCLIPFRRMHACVAHLPCRLWCK